VFVLIFFFLFAIDKVGIYLIIMKNVHIEKNSIITTGSIFTKDILENRFFVGNPRYFYKLLDKF